MESILVRRLDLNGEEELNAVITKHQVLHWLITLLLDFDCCNCIGYSCYILKTLCYMTNIVLDSKPESFGSHPAFFSAKHLTAGLACSGSSFPFKVSAFVSFIPGTLPTVSAQKAIDNVPAGHVRFLVISSRAIRMVLTYKSPSNFKCANQRQTATKHFTAGASHASKCLTSSHEAYAPC